jgi:hypothetical protein
MTADSRARWAALLRTPMDAPPADAGAAFLRTLPGDDFAPPAERVAAANALAGTAAPIGRDAEIERLLRDEVAALGARFWSLAPVDRLLAWSELSRLKAAPEHLRSLEPGLDVVVPELSDPAAGELAALIRELFVMPPRARAIRRNTWLLERAAEADKWRAAHATLQRDAPALAALEPELRTALDPNRRDAFAAFVEGASAGPDRPTRMSSEVALAGFAGRVRHRRAGDTGGGSAPGYVGDEYAYEAADRARAKRIFQLSVIAIAVLVVCVLGGIGNRAKRESAIAKRPDGPVSAPRSSGSPAPIYPLSSEPPAPTIRQFTVAEVAEFEKYELDLAAGVPRQQPSAYAVWRLVGRPRGVDDEKPFTLSPSVVEFDRDAIRACVEYDRRKTGEPPSLYHLWLAAGRPAFAGSYPLRSNVTPPR